MNDYKSAITQLTFLISGIALIICLLAPINLGPNSKVSPDYLFCFIFIFLNRQPAAASYGAILFLCLLADFLWFRPLGLVTLTILLSTEFLKWLIKSRNRIGLFEEIVYITLLLLLTVTIQELVKALTLIPSLSITNIINYVLSTLFIYLLLLILIKLLPKSNLL